MNDDIVRAPVGSVSIEVTYQVPRQLLQDLLISAFEGGSNYWIVRADGHGDDDLYELPFNGGCITLIVDDYDEKVHPITEASLAHGVQLLSQKLPKQFSRLITESWDAETADCVLQLATLKELVFG